MEIKGKVHCMFEQSGTFKNEFKKLGYEAYDYDIQNNFGQTDHIIDLFAEIEKGHEGKPSIFDNITKRSDNRKEFYDRLIKFCAVCMKKGIRLIVENPWSEQTYLKANFIKAPDIVDMNRMERGDYFKKPTAYFYFNCNPTYLEIIIQIKIIIMAAILKQAHLMVMPIQIIMAIQQRK